MIKKMLNSIYIKKRIYIGKGKFILPYFINFKMTYTKAFKKMQHIDLELGKYLKEKGYKIEDFEDEENMDLQLDQSQIFLEIYIGKRKTDKVRKYFFKNNEEEQAILLMCSLAGMIHKHVQECISIKINKGSA